VSRALAGERGVALVIVLLVLALLLTIAGEFALAMRLEGRTTLNFAASIAAGHLAEAGYQRAVAEILRSVGPPGSNPPVVYVDKATGLLVLERPSALGLLAKPPSREDLPLGTGRFSYRIDDEGGRINVNTSDGRLRDLLEAMEVSREVRDVIVDSLQDWKDGNENYRLNGAESDYYLGLPVPHKSKNAMLESVEELLQIKGMTRQIFYGTPDKPGLVDYVTVFSRGINVNTVSPMVLRALRLAEAEVEQLVANRPYPTLPRVPANLASRGIGLVSSNIFRIRATGEIPGQGRRTLLAIVDRQSPGGTTRVKLLSWRWLHEDEAAP
jgi:general secretion pathway protein K